MKTLIAQTMADATAMMSDAPPPWPRPAADTVPVGAGRVLVVDDDDASRLLLADWLGAYGHQVSTAADGPEALLAVERETPDVIVLDVTMPGMDGFTVCERL